MTEVFLTLTEVFLTQTEVFPCVFLSWKANARIKLAKTGHSPHLSKLVAICVVRLLFVLFYVLFVCKCVLYYYHRVTTQLQLTNTSYTHSTGPTRNKTHAQYRSDPHASNFPFHTFRSDFERLTQR